MSKVDPIPSDDELRPRRKPKFIVNQDDVSVKDETRVRSWAAGVMQKNETKLNPNRFKNHAIITSDVIKPEDIDIKGIYPFPDLNWIIFRNDSNNTIMWSIMLRSKGKVLCTSTFAKI